MATDMAMAMAITATMGKKDEEKENKLSVVIKKSLSDRSGYRINHYFVSDGTYLQDLNLISEQIPEEFLECACGVMVF